MLQQVGEYNKKETVADLIPLPPRGTTVQFRLRQPLKLFNEKGTMSYPRSVFIRPTCNVQDKDGVWHKIGLVKSVDKEGTPTNVLTIDWNPYLTGGLLNFVSGNSADDDMTLQYLLNWPGNKSSGQQQADVPQIIETVDAEGEAKARIGARNERYEAMQKAFGLKYSGVKEMLYAHGFPVTGVQQSDRDVLMDYAEKNPAAFMSEAGSDGIKAKAQFRQAIQIGLLELDYTTNQVRFKGSGQPLMEGLMDMDEAALANEWVIKSTQSPALSDTLSREIKQEESNAKGGSEKEGDADEDDQSDKGAANPAQKPAAAKASTGTAAKK